MGQLMKLARGAMGMDGPGVDPQELIEAIAGWVEQLRDTVGASAGLEQAILATENRAPRCIRPHVQQLTAALRFEPFDVAILRFARDVAHPMTDFVAVALITSVRHQARDIGTLLGVLADSAREEAKLQLRVWVSRSRTRSAVRIILWSVTVFVVALGVFDGAYLSPFLSPTGLMVLAADIGLFGLAFLMLKKLSVDNPLPRILELL